MPCVICDIEHDNTDYKYDGDDSYCDFSPETYEYDPDDDSEYLEDIKESDSNEYLPPLTL